MKSIMTTLSMMLLALTINAQSTLRGDVNGDGEVTTNDIAMIVNHILGVPNEGFIFGNADIYRDGEIDVNDVMLIVKIIMGEEIPSSLKGDVNGDGEVTTNDILMLVSYILEGSDEGMIINNADVNDDGEIDINDVMEMANIILGGGSQDDDNRLPIFDDDNPNTGSIITDGSEVLGNGSSLWEDEE